MAESSQADRNDAVEKWVRERLENALPLTRQEMGARPSYDLIRGYVARFTRHVEPISDVLEDFVIYLARAGVSPHAVVVALFELVRHERCEAGPRPLSEAELQQTPVSRLLTMRVCRHPAARAIEVAGEVPATLLALYPNLAGGDAILLSRRVRGDLVLPLTADELDLFRLLARPRNLVTLLGEAGSTPGRSMTFQRLVKLGAVIGVGQAA